MHNKDIFTLDPMAYPLVETQQFVKEQESKGRYVVAIVDPGVSIKKNLPAYIQGEAADVFLKAPHHAPQRFYEGRVWPGPVHFVDFLNPRAKAYWTEQLRTFRDVLPFAGLWLDMCEPADMGAGHRDQRPDPHNEHDTLNFPPYAINNGGAEEDIFLKTIPMNVRHASHLSHLSVHNVYGLTESHCTAEAMEAIEPTKRHFLLTRSTFPGSGRFTGHWLGDNYSDFENMKHSIGGMMDFQLFGISMVGADICGFLGTSDEELCARWMALGSFYPFARNHNAERAECISQEPYQWPKVAEATQRYFGFRYSILSYWYTLSYLAHETGRPIIRPMFFEFPQFKALWDNEEQFMLGSALLVAPVLQRGVSTVRVALPPGVWYDAMDEYAAPIITHSLQYVNVFADLLTMPIFLRGGHILLRQTPELSVRDTIKHDFHLVAALDESGRASGMAYFDDTVSSDPGAIYTSVDFQVTCDQKKCTILITGYFGFNVLQSINSLTIVSPVFWSAKLDATNRSISSRSSYISGRCLGLRDLSWSLARPSDNTIEFSPLSR